MEQSDEHGPSIPSKRCTAGQNVVPAVVGKCSDFCDPVRVSSEAGSNRALLFHFAKGRQKGRSLGRSSCWGSNSIWRGFCCEHNPVLRPFRWNGAQENLLCGAVVPERQSVRLHKHAVPLSKVWKRVLLPRLALNTLLLLDLKPPLGRQLGAQQEGSALEQRSFPLKRR